MFLMWLGEQITARGIGNGLADHLRRASSPPAERARRTARSRPHRRAVAGLHPVASWSIAVAIDRLHRVHRARAAAHPGAISQAPAGQPHVRRRLDPHAAEDQHLGRHPADLRQFAAADAGDDRRLLDQRAVWLQWTSSPASSRTASRLYMLALRAADHLLRVLLHRGCVQPGGDGRQPEEIRRLHPRHPARQAHGGLFRPCADPADHGRRASIWSRSACCRSS